MIFSGVIWPRFIQTQGSGAFRGHRKIPVVWNELISFINTFILFFFAPWTLQSFPHENHCGSFSYTSTLLFCWKIKSCCDPCFLQQSRPQVTDQICIKTLHTAYNTTSSFKSIKFQSLFYSELNEIWSNYVWILKWANLHCNWTILTRVLNLPKRWIADYRCILEVHSS